MKHLLLVFALVSTLAGATPVVPLASPAEQDTGESSLYTGPDGTVYLSFSGPGRADGERALWLSTLAPGAAPDAWSAPRAIVSTPLLMENWADFASLTVGTDGQLWAQWFQNHPGEDAHGYSGWLARSRDGGATWTEPAPLGHEFVSLAPLSGGRVLAVWLESTRSGRGHAGHAAPSKEADAPYAPSMRLKSRLLAADGATLQDWVVDPDVCTCCQTTLAPLGGDRVFLSYRGHTRGEIRDNFFAVFQQHIWSEPRLLHADGWKIPACPVNGPAADAQGESLAVAWFTAADGIARVQAKVSRDGGITFSPAIPLDLGRPLGRVDLAKLPDGSALVSWIESKSETTAAGLYVRRVFPDGAVSAPLLVADTSAVRASGFPRLAARAGDRLPVIVSWTNAVPRDPANPKSPAATRVRLAQVEAATLVPTPRSATASALPPVRTLVRGDDLAQVEICAPVQPTHVNLTSLP
jgi:hypothetical protein